MRALALPDIAAAIDREHQAAQQAARTALAHAVECGRLLLEAKAALPHGGWLPWLAENCTLRPRTAQAYMRLARELPKLPEPDAQRVADLSVRDAIAQLARQAHDFAALPAAEATGVLHRAADDRLRDVLVHATNQQRRAWETPDEDTSTQWIGGAPERSLPPPDARLYAALAAVIDESGLPPEVVLETLNALYCDIQNRHQLVTPQGLPAEAA